MNIMKKILSLMLSFTILFSTVGSVFAIEQNSADDLENSESIEVAPRSGGWVSSTTTLKKCTFMRDEWEYKYLTNDWAPAMNYTVSSTVTVSSSTTLSVGLSGGAKDSFNAQTNLTYGTSVSTASSVGTTIKADPSRNSKLRFEAKKKRYSVIVTVANKYYDTSTGYRTTYTDYKGEVVVPLKNETYIRPVYK